MLRTTPIFKVGLQQGFATGGTGSIINLRCKNPKRRTSHMGRSRTKSVIDARSAYLPITDLQRTLQHVGSVPNGEMECFLLIRARALPAPAFHPRKPANALVRSCGVELRRLAPAQIRWGRARLLRAAGRALDWPVRD
jgi:hypothetical protein